MNKYQEALDNIGSLYMYDEDGEADCLLSELLVEDFITISKKQNEISLINNDKEHISTILLFALNSWKQFIHHLNEQENIYLCELRDKLIPDLLSGKVEIKDEESHRKESKNGII